MYHRLAPALHTIPLNTQRVSTLICQDFDNFSISKKKVNKHDKYNNVNYGQKRTRGVIENLTLNTKLVSVNSISWIQENSLNWLIKSTKSIQSLKTIFRRKLHF